MGRYAGPGAALRGQPRAPRQPSSRRENAPTNGPDASASDYAPSATSPKDLPDTPRTHQRQWSDASSLQYQQHGNGYQSSYQHQSPYMDPSSGPQSPPPMSSSPISTSSYFGDQRSHGYGYPNNNNQYVPSPSQRQQSGYPASVASSTSSRPNQGYSQYPSQRGYNNYDQSPMMSPTSPDSWRSSPGSRGYPSQTSRQPNNNYASSVLSDDHGHQGGNGSRSRNYPYESDSDDYYNRQGARPSGGNNTRGAHTLSYSTSIASNTSSVLAARRERNERNERIERNERNQRQRAPTDEWLTSPTGTEHETEILSWSDDEAIVTKAVRSPPTGYSNEKNLPPIPGRGGTALPPQQTPSVTIPKPGQGSKRMDSDMIKVEVGGTTTVIPTEEGSGVNFIKTVSPSSSPPSSRYDFPTSSGGAQSMTGAATSLRAAAFNQKNVPTDSPKRPGRNSLDWGGQRISLDDMLSTPSPLTRDSRQQAMNSWKTSPPLKPTGKEEKDFTELKNKRRSSLPDKFVPNWNEHASTWRNSIGQRRPPSWMAPSKDDTPSKDDFLSQKQKWNEAGALSKDWEKKLAGSKATDHDKRLSDRSLHRRSRSWSPRPKDASSKDKKRDSFVSSISSRSQSRSRSYSRNRAGSRDERNSFRSLSRSRSRSRSRSIRSKSRSRSRSSAHSRYHSRSRSVSISRSRSRSHSRSRSRSPGDRYKIDKGSKEDPHRDSTRFSWHSTDDIKENRRSWESMGQGKDTSKKTTGPGLGGPRYSTAGEEDLTDYDDDYKDKSGLSVSRGISAQAGNKSDDAFKDAPKKDKDIDSDSDSMDSPPLKVQYRRPGGIDDDDNEPISSKHPASIISTFNLPPATSPTSPSIPPLPSPTATKGGMDFLSYKPTPPPVPSSPPLAAQPGQSMMTSVTTVSIEAATAVMSSSRVSVASFTNVPGQSRPRDMTETDLETDFDSDNESTVFHRDKDLPQPSFVTMTSGTLSTPPSSNPISINTSLKRNESTASSVSALSARSAKSFMSSSSVHSASSILSASPPPQRAPPPVPFGAEPSTKRSGSSGSARGVRSGLSKQILPPTVPPPPGPPPEMPASGSKPSYGILPPPIPSSFTSDTSAPPATTVAASSSAIQIQMLADEDQSRSQMGAISVETDERLLTKLNNRVAQLEKELEFAQQDLEASLDDATSLQNKIQDLEAELDDLHNDSTANAGKVNDQQFEDAKHEWRAEKDRLLKDMDGLRDDHEDELKESLAKERSKHAQELEDLEDRRSSDLADLKKQMEKLREDHTVALEEAGLERKRIQESHEQELYHFQEQLEAVGHQREQDLQNLRVEHESELRTTVEDWEAMLANAHQEQAQALESVSVGHRQDLEKFEGKVAEMELLLKTSHTERDQAKEALEHHKKETEQALDRLEVVLTEDKKAHAELIRDLEGKAKRLEDRVAELEGELQELTQDNVQIVEELQRREETWTEERALLRAGAEGDESGMEARLQEMHEQLVAVTESKRQADAQFQGIVKGLLREASANKKELEARQQALDQERQDKDNIAQEVEALQEQLASVHQSVEAIQREKEATEQMHAELESNHQEMTRHFEDQKRNGSEAMLMAQKELESKLAEHSHQLEQERLKVQELQALMDQDRSKSGQEKQREQFVWQQRLDQLEGALKAEKAHVKKLEQEADATIKIQTDLLQSMERDAASSQKKLEASLIGKMKEMEMAFAEDKKKMQQSTEEDRRRIQQSSDESKMIMQQAMDEELQKVRQQTQQELAQRFEAETLEKETRLQQQLDSIHQQELAMALQEVVARHEQQMRGMKREHDTALENTKAALQQSSISLEKQAKAMETQLQQTRAMEVQLQQAKAIEDQLEKLQLQAEQERSEKEVAIKDRTFLERRMAGHDRRQKELEENLESLQQQLDQARAKSGQDVQDLERSKSNLERKLGMAREDVEELNKIRDELESDRDELRKEVQRLKKSGGGSSGGSNKQDSAAWEAERQGLKEQLRKLEDEVQIMLEKNMNLTIELSMK
ncbi:hypothetical protein BGZ81_006537 [Podila clonocystis]|nr:hypothetical protein BGZ81_006537 [Podila clonocystis]